MNNKCNWKDGKLEPCKNSYNFLELKDTIKGKVLKVSYFNEVLVSYCLFCGADIRKPNNAKEKAIQKFAHEMINTKDSMDVFEQGRIVVETIEIYLENTSTLDSK